MSADFDKRVLQLVDSLLELPVEQRDAAITDACAGDESLKRAVQSHLIACDRLTSGEDFLRGPAAQFAQPILNEVEAARHDLEPHLAVAAVLQGRVEFVRLLGSGGSAVVYLAHDVRHDRDVAIKIIRLASDPAQRSRFLREIAVAARLHHPYIIPLIDSGEAEDTLFYVMPYINGESLRQRLERERVLQLRDALAIVRDVAEALDHANSAGIIHRDIKPQNIMLSAGHAFVADFGVALALGNSFGGIRTESGVAIGTPAYMSPEQALASHHIDSRSDVYALGCTVYELLAGEVPFRGTDTRAVIAKHLNAPAPSLSPVRPDLPAGVDEVLAKALAKRPNERYDTAGAFCEALRAASPRAIGNG